MEHRFSYKWNLSDGYPAKGIEYHGGKVFSCFACGGGSTMGYKLAGFDVIGFNEIDPRMAECYKANHNPKYCFVEPIQTFKDREDLPQELFELDILDGSPPCSSFSMAGNREKDWGKDKKFREGQAEQVLDTLFFDFIDLAKRLQPKVVIAENVKGMLLGEAQRYVDKVLTSFDDAGYYVDFTLLDASKMGVPQRRERVFFYAVRKDLYAGEFTDIFQSRPLLKLQFDEPDIPFKAIADESDLETLGRTKGSELWDRVSEGESFSKAHPNGSYFGDHKEHLGKPLKTIIGETNHGGWHPYIKRMLNKSELCNGGTFPIDYAFNAMKPKYLIGMSVPPVMMAQIASRVREQWLPKQELF